MKKPRATVFFLLLFLAAGCGKQWSFAVVGDNRSDSAHERAPEVFSRIIGAINETDADLLIHLGDLIRGACLTAGETRRQFADVSSILGGARARLLVVPGNHDMNGAAADAEFERAFGKTPWVRAHKGWTLIGLSTEQPASRGLITGEQLRWLRERLAERRKKGRTVVFMHRPVRPTPAPGGRFRSIPQPGLHRIFVEQGVNAVFAGHEHHFHSETRDGVLYVITGGGGSALLPGGFHHFTSVRLKGDALSVKPIRVK